MRFPKTICHGKVLSLRATRSKSITAEMCLSDIVVSVLLIAAGWGGGGGMI